MCRTAVRALLPVLAGGGRYALAKQREEKEKKQSNDEKELRNKMADRSEMKAKLKKCRSLARLSESSVAVSMCVWNSSTVPMENGTGKAGKNGNQFIISKAKPQLFTPRNHTADSPAHEQQQD